ncbi:hypothetical protein PF005_g27305 [Phytophthora fragariae]|uniref:Uncharacterized protein n=1 Tax=Phytophthora fragariae TaxID=53985 RepID=A0A6A3QYT3_9STRA|nr:hypothetical protein PF003_g27663 [Phytophthora fragariae]KAE8921833.1 hypothetical protein PF009_g27894 [Phytophthora fragariae]KAE8970653.1 hypothetical protein PF011_g26338 [Phytophthora fragariae]KAE9069058.1 hypothetical protein PF010_g26806 [Phytophthora fragariae]KAE9069726.1 hypothetical protein PF007_g27208 [Phytophthora fragariae]
MTTLQQLQDILQRAVKKTLGVRRLVSPARAKSSSPPVPPTSPARPSRSARCSKRSRPVATGREPNGVASRKSKHRSYVGERR